MTAPPQLPASEPPSALMWWRYLRKHWGLGVAVALAVVLCDIFFTLGQRRIYEATATILIDPAPPRPLGKDVQAVVDVGNGSYWSNKEYFETQTKLLGGLAMSRETARALNLQLDRAFIANVPPGGPIPGVVKTVDLDDAAAIVNSRLTVEIVRDTRLVTVRVSDADPMRARRILSTLIDRYLEGNVDQAVQSTAAAAEWLSNQSDKLKSELEKSELALHDYKIDKQILSVSLDDQSNMLRGQMQQLSEAMTGVGARIEQLKARVRELDKIDSNDPTELPATALLESNVLSNLRQSYIQAKSELSSLLGSGKGENHPDSEAAMARTEMTRQALMNEVRNIQGAVRNDLAAAIREEQGVASLLASAKHRALDLNMLEIEYRRLERSKSNTEKLYGLVLERTKETELTGLMRFNNIRVTERPITGKRPIKPRVPFNIALGLMIGLLLGGGTAVARGYLDQTVRSPEELEAELALPLLGIIPAFSDRAKTRGYYSRQHHSGQQDSIVPDEMSMELIAHALPSSHAAESVRVIRTSLTFASPDKPYKRILVTSSSPSEGKTTVAVSIAIAFAQAGQKVLILDADLRRPRIHRVFRCSNAQGLSTSLQDSESLQSSIVATQVPNLSVLPGGPHVPNPAELLESERFRQLLQELTSRFDKIIVDSPPIMAVTDAAILSSHVDATVLVVRVGQSKVGPMRQAARKLKETSTPIAGIVLNALESPRWGANYYSYYGNRKYHGPYGEQRDA